MTDRLVELLYLLSGGLLPPVLLVLTACMVGALLTLGGLIRETIDRGRFARRWKTFLLRVREDAGEARAFYELSLTGYPARFQRETASIRENRSSVRKCLEDLDLAIGRRLGRLSVQTRVGPMLGLVGTLVPLGPALTGLASGDIQALAGNLVIAFTTTVFGILVGAFAYGVAVIRRGWYEQDLSDLEFVAESLFAAERTGADSLICEEYDRAG